MTLIQQAGVSIVRPRRGQIEQLSRIAYFLHINIQLYILLYRHRLLYDTIISKLTQVYLLVQAHFAQV